MGSWWTGLRDRPGRRLSGLAIAVGWAVLTIAALGTTLVAVPPNDVLALKSGTTLVREAPSAEVLAAYLREVDRADEAARQRAVDTAWQEHARPLDLSDRDLRGARMLGVRLFDADFQDTDLRGAKLGDADLQGADLRGAKLGFAYLQGADLRDADLQGADLWGATLQGADLLRAALQGADLRDAALQGADLRGADLQGAGLRDADLHGVDLRGARLDLADLSGVRMKPPGDDLWAAFARLTKLLGSDKHTLSAVPDARRRVLAHMEDAWTRAFEAPTRIDPLDELSAEGAMHDGEGLFCGWPAPPEEAIYRWDLAAYLTGWACLDGGIGEGIARRALRDGNAVLATAFLEQQCEAVRGLSSERRVLLQALADRRGERAGSDADGAGD